MASLVVLVAVGLTAILAIYQELLEAHDEAIQLTQPRHITSPSRAAGGTSMQRYRFSGFEPVPSGIDVVRQEIIVKCDGMLVHPVIELPLDATEVIIEVPEDSEIEVVRRWYDDAATPNFSESEPVVFHSIDNIAPPPPTSLGSAEHLGEVSW